MQTDSQTTLTNSCGTTVYEMVEITSNTEPAWIDFNPSNGVISMAPGLDVTPAIYNMALKATLSDYSAVTKVEYFTVRVRQSTDCAYDVISLGQTFSNEIYTFSQTPMPIAFDPQLTNTIDNCPR